MKHNEKRTGIAPMPDKIERYLNELQLLTYHRMNSFGWQIKFIRRPLFQQPVCVLTNQDETEIAVLEEDGTLNKQPNISIRSNEKKKGE